MATIKIALSLQETLFSQVEDVARELQVSPSQIVAMALELFVQRHNNQHLLRVLNEVYAEVESSESRSIARRNQHRRSVEGEW